MKKSTSTPERADDEEAPAPKKKAKPRWKRWLIDAVVVLLIIFGVRWWQQRDLPKGEAPPLAGASLNGEALGLSAEQPTMVHFWATWCGVCKLMDESVAAVSDDYRVVTVATQSGTPNAVREWMQEHELWEGDASAFDTIADPRGRLARAWNVSAFPTTFFIGRDGEIEHVEVGFTSEMGLRARMWLLE